MRVQESLALCADIKGQFDLGKSLQRSARWIPVDRRAVPSTGNEIMLTKSNRVSDQHIQEVIGKTVWETEYQYERATAAQKCKGGAQLKESIALAGDYSRICRPSLQVNRKKKIAFIIWRRDSPDDGTPAWDKVVSQT